MMKLPFKTNVIKLALGLAFPVVSIQAFAADAYPAQPPYLSTSVTPNIMLLVDTSGSMLQNDHNQWFEIPDGGGYDSATSCQSYYPDQGYASTYGTWDYAWTECVKYDYTNWRTRIDVHPDTKMSIAKNAMTCYLALLHI
jgi:type IV pilus assembly protein PilY1